MSEPVPRLMAITDTTVAPGSTLLRRLGDLLGRCRPGSVLVQLRDTHLAVTERLALGRELGALCRRSGQQLIVNDRCDLAVLIGASGVHLAERSIDALDARRILGERAWVSRSEHDPMADYSQALDAVVLSPILEPRKGREALGLSALRTARAALDAQRRRRRALLYALGGVAAERVPALLDAGADGIAAIGAVLDGRPLDPLIDALAIGR